MDNRPQTNSRLFNGTAIYNICPTCALEYCPNKEFYNVVGLKKGGFCQICESRSQIGTTDPINYGGLRRE